MSTQPAVTTAVPEVPAAQPQTPRRPIPGSLVRVVRAFGAGKSVELYAIVLTIAPALPSLVGSDGQPTVTVAYVKPNPDARIMGSGDWHMALERVSDVAPASHAEVKSGARGIYWVDVLPDAGAAIAADSFASAELPQIEGKASTVFERLTAEDFFARDAKVVPPAVEAIKVERIPGTTFEPDKGTSVVAGIGGTRGSANPEGGTFAPGTQAIPSAADLDAAAAEAAAKLATTAEAQIEGHSEPEAATQPAVTEQQPPEQSPEVQHGSGNSSTVIADAQTEGHSA